MNKFIVSENMLLQQQNIFSCKSRALKELKTCLPNYYKEAIKADTKARFNNWIVRNIPFIGRYVVRFINVFMVIPSSVFTNKKLQEYSLKSINYVNQLEQDIESKIGILSSLDSALQMVKSASIKFIDVYTSRHKAFNEDKQKEVKDFMANVFPSYMHVYLCNVLKDHGYIKEKEDFFQQYSHTVNEIKNLFTQFEDNMQNNTRDFARNAFYFTPYNKASHEKSMEKITTAWSPKKPKADILNNYFGAGEVLEFWRCEHQTSKVREQHDDILNARILIQEELSGFFTRVVSIFTCYAENDTKSMRHEIQSFAEMLGLEAADLKWPEFFSE